jgi:hypothetical protein
MNTMQFSFPTFLRSEFDKKLASINKKVLRIGGSRQVEVLGEDHFNDTIKAEDGKEVSCHFTKVTLSLPVTPKIEGYSLVGIITNEDEAKLIKSFTGENLTKIDHTKCDHCNTNRYRTRTYILRKGDDTKVIGSTCMKEYLGLDIDGILSRFLKFEKSVGELSEFSRINGNHIDQILEAVRYTFSNKPFYISQNKAAVYSDCTKYDVDIAMGLKELPHVEGVPSVEEIKEKLVSEYASMDTNTNFNSNVVNTLFYQYEDQRDLRDVILDKARGVFYWAVYNVLKPKRKVQPQPTTTSTLEELTKGALLSGEGRVVMAKDVHSQYGTSRLVEVKTIEGKSFKTFSTSDSAFKVNPEDTVKFSGKFKKNDEFRGKKSILFSHAKFETI